MFLFFTEYVRTDCLTAQAVYNLKVESKEKFRLIDLILVKGLCSHKILKILIVSNNFKQCLGPQEFQSLFFQALNNYKQLLVMDLQLYSIAKCFNKKQAIRRSTPLLLTQKRTLLNAQSKAFISKIVFLLQSKNISIRAVIKATLRFIKACYQAFSYV